MITRAPLSAAAALSALAGAAWGQEAQVSEVVVTAAPYAVSLDTATTNVDVLRREQLDRAPSGGLGDALAGVPGVRSSAFGPGASRPIIRGLSGPRVLVLSNGLGQVDASALSPDHAVATDPQEAERIEVLRGPAALAYGGSAIGGVVNILDERIPTGRVEAVGGRLLVSRSSVDGGSSMGGALKAGGGGLAVSIDGLRRRSGDYKIPTFPESRRLMEAEGEAWPGKADSVVANSFVRLDAIGGGLAYESGLNRLGGSVKRTETSYGVPGHGHEGEDEAAVSIALKQTRYDLRGEYHLHAGLFDVARLSAGYADYTHVELEGDEVGTRFLSEGAEARLELIQPDRSGWQGALGLQALTRDLEAIGEEAFVPANRTREWGVFTLQRLEKARWGVEGGLRLEGRDVKTPLGRLSFTGVSASAGGYLKMSEGWFLSASTSRTERAPAAEELLADGPHPATHAYELGDRTLQPEVSRSLDLSARYEAGRLRVEAHAFTARYDGFIDLRPIGLTDAASALPIHKFTQTDARFHGGELEAAWRLWDGPDGRSLKLEGAADYVRGSTDLGPPAHIPPWSATGRAILEGGAWTAAAEVRRVGRQTRVAALELPTDGYTTVSLHLTVRPLGADGFKLSLDAYNLTDAEAREHASFLKDIAPAPGRNVRIGLGYRF